MINHGIAGRFAITEGKWKLIMAHRKLKIELYDLASDPGEKNDVNAEHPGVVKSLTKKITDIVRNGRTTPGTRQANDTGHWKDLTWMSAD